METISKDEYNKAITKFEGDLKADMPNAFKKLGKIPIGVIALILEEGTIKIAGLDPEIPLQSLHQEMGSEGCANFIRECIEDVQPIAVAWMSESWMIKREKATEEKPSEAEDKVECVVLNVETHNTVSRTVWDIKRADESTLEISFESGWESKDPGKVTGNFDNLLNKLYVNTEESSKAKA